MARPQATDPLHSFRFHVTATEVTGLDGDPLQPTNSEGIVGQQIQAGFQAVSTPEYTVEAAEYREGVKTYTEKYPGIPTVNDLTLSRGVAKEDTAFIAWILAAIEGREYRSDLTIFHGLRPARSSPLSGEDFSDSTSKRYLCEQCFPIRVKIAGDLDASTSDVSITEVDIAVERFGVQTSGGDSQGI